jgi:hypothetical protein
MEDEELGLIMEFIRLCSLLNLYIMPPRSLDPHSLVLWSVAAETIAAFPPCRYSTIDGNAWLLCMLLADTRPVLCVLDAGIWQSDVD